MAAIGLTAVECVLALAERGNCRADLVQTYDVLCEIGVKCLLYVAGGCVITEIGCYGAFEVCAVVCAARVFEGEVGAFVDGDAFLEFDFRAVVDTGDAAEGEHQREVLGPLGCAAVEAYAVVGAGTVVVGVDIYDIPRSVIIEVVAFIGDAHGLVGGVEVVVHREVDYVEARGLRVIRFVPCAVLHEHVVGVVHRAGVLKAGEHIAEGCGAFADVLLCPPVGGE